MSRYYILKPSVLFLVNSLSYLRNCFEELCCQSKGEKIPFFLLHDHFTWNIDFGELNHYVHWWERERKNTQQCFVRPIFFARSFSFNAFKSPPRLVQLNQFRNVHVSFEWEILRGNIISEWNLRRKKSSSNRLELENWCQTHITHLTKIAFKRLNVCVCVANSLFSLSF